MRPRWKPCAWRRLGKKGSVSALLATMGSLSPDERKVKGPQFNGLKDAVTEAIAARKAAAGAMRRWSTPGLRKARRHPARRGPKIPAPSIPSAQVLEEVIAIFADLGFGVAEGPDVEYDDYNFTKLNIPPDHPARQMQDTFYVAPQADGSSHVLRTHTSPVQVRTMLKQQAAHPHHLAGPHLSRRFRRHPFAHVPPGRSAGDG